MSLPTLPSPETLRQLLRYDPETGKLLWRERGPEWFSSGNTSPEARATGWNARYSGMPALSSANRYGHLRGAILGHNVLAHRAIWAMFYGAWPSCTIDHINGNPEDNRIVNLRETTLDQNKANAGKRPRRNPSSKFIGVHWQSNRWVASVGHGHRTRYGGRFKNEVDAAKSRDRLALSLKGEFARLNFEEIRHET